MQSFLHDQAERWSIGLDLGADQVKFICLAHLKGTHELMAHGLFKRSNTDGIRAALRHPAIRNGDIRANVADPGIRIQKLDLPEVPESELDEIAKWAIKDQLENSLEEYLFRYDRTGEVPTKTGVPYLVIAVPQRAIENLEKELKGLGIRRAHVIEPNIYALANSVLHNYEPQKDDRYAVIDLGKVQALFGVVSPHGLVNSRDLKGISGEILTQLLSSDRGVSLEEAERYKISEPDLLRGPQAGNTEGLVQYLSRAAVEIQHSLDNYALLYPKDSITNILLTGGESCLKILSPYIQDTLKIPTRVLDPFRKVDISRFEKTNLDQTKALYGVAMGLAL